MQQKPIEKVQNNWWSKLDWAGMEGSIRRMQFRIFKATREGDSKRAKHLMKLLARSWTAKVLAIRAVTQLNKGKVTPGIDGEVYLKDEDRMALARECFDYRTWRFQPALRRYIPKPVNPGAPRDIPVKLRPLSIMAIKDRVIATIVSYPLNAQWEAWFESNVFGFRPGRCTQDAIRLIQEKLSQRDMAILDADIKSFFDMVKHNAILSRVTCFKDFIKNNLMAGVVERGRITRPATGIMQGSPLSPILANIALHGLEKRIERENSACVIRYADDLVVLAPTKRDMVQQVIPCLVTFLAERGLELKQEKTRITTRREGFNFLGFTIEKPRIKLFVKPQKEKLLRFLTHIREIIKENKQVAQRTLIARLNPVMSGWTTYYKYSDAYAAFAKVDSEIWRMLWRWARRRHPNKGRKWVAAKYFHVVGNQTWMFKDADTGISLKSARAASRGKYGFVVGQLSPLDGSPASIKAWSRRKQNEVLHALEQSANGKARLPSGCYLPSGR